ncbi:MAG: bifunctional DNA-formamidopyrimidine glycosylase/DNA-(apurinic or apyrimidinic site) lyase [Proteobacteria bacterium]|nr:bifunctional DNA-formamidopyrimidine glycosylase/DNA-(apurinic or apyrimidinic site) lyase [Pseudomonadota bacterium]
MPELPEVETVGRGLRRLMKNRRLQKLTLRRKDLRAPFPPGMEKMLQGRRIAEVRRRAKYLLIEMSGGKTLLVHLGMSGRMAAEKTSVKPGKHDHVIFELDNPPGAVAVARSAEQSRRIKIVFCDPRRFGLMDVFETSAASRHKLLRHLGVEPFSKDLNAGYLKQKFKGRKLAIKVALMNQRLIAGIGNIYACEALFTARINPRKASGRLKKEELQKLVPAIRRVLEKSIALGGSSLRDYVQADGGLGSFQNEFAVYGRKGEKCPGCTCDIKKTGGIQALVMSGRSTFYCPVKQK